MSAEPTYLAAGLCLLVAVLLPTVTRRFAVSPPLVLLLMGVGLGFTPFAEGIHFSVMEHRAAIEHVTELTVLIALMGVGLAIDRPLDLLKPHTWRRWSPTWRLLAVGMPLSILAVALLGWLGLGLSLASAVLLAGALSPTDPVLASDVQVGGPGSAMAEESEHEDGTYRRDPTVVSEQGEVRFALTSEAGLNDGLAFPFVYLAIILTAGGSLAEHLLQWAAWYLLAKVVIGLAAGIAVGWLLSLVAFRSPRPSLRLAEQGEPLLALSALLTAYGVSELCEGYGFLAVFACAVTLRAAERRHDYHRGMHEVIERLERLLTLAILIFLGMALARGVLDALDWRGVVAGVALVFVIRPLAGWLSLTVLPRRGLLPGGTTRKGRWTIAFFGVRGVGSLYYLAYASGHAHFPDLAWLWSTVAFTVALSVLVHGIASTPVINRLAVDPA